LLHTLFFVPGIGFRGLKKISSELQRQKILRQWATEFQVYYQKVRQGTLKHIRKLIEEEEKAGKDVASYEKAYSDLEKMPVSPGEPMGTMFYFFSGKQGETINVFPWGIDILMAVKDVRDLIKSSVVVLSVDLATLKKQVDRSL
jgi:hypothetical protein